MSENFSVELQKIETYRKENPSAQKLTDKQILLIMAQNNKVQNLDKGVKLEKTNIQTNNQNVDTPPQNVSIPLTKKEAEDVAIKTIISNADSALKTIENQDNGVISETYESIKEKTGSELTKENISKVVYAQKESAELLKLAQNNELTFSRYCKIKHDILLNTFPLQNMTEHQRDSVANMIATLSPAETDKMLKKSLALPDKNKKNYNETVNEFLSEFKNATTKSALVLQNGDYPTTKKVQTSPKKPYIPQDGERLMSFDETFKLEQGVEFKKENIEKYNKSAIEFSEANKHTQTKNEIHKLLDDSISLVDGNNKHGVTPQVLKSSENKLKNAIYQTLSNFYGDNELDMSRGLKELTGENFSIKNGSVQMDIPANSGFVYNTTGYDLVRIAKRMLNKIDENYDKAMNGKSLESYAQKMAEDNKIAYGTKNAAQLAQAYRQDQDGLVKNVRAGIEYIGAGVMVAGIICYPPAALAGGLVTSFGGVGVEALEEKSKNRPNPEKIKELKQEFMTNSLLMATGFGAGQAGATAKTILTAKNCPKLLAMAGDIGTDATLSLLSDMALTGQISLEGEGFSQIMSLVAGHKGKLISGVATAKDSFSSPNLKLKNFKSEKGNDKLLTHKIVGNEKDVKVVVDEQTSQIMHEAADNLHNLGLKRENNITRVMEDAGFGTNDTQVMTHRTKGNQSLYDKLKNYAIDNAEKSKTVNDAINSVKDLVGTRTAVTSADFTTHPDVAKLIKEGKMQAAQMRAAELQSEPTLNRLKTIIDKESAGNKTLSIERISNYKGKDGIPYFSDRQLADLKLYAEQRGVKLNYVVRAAESDPKFSQMKQEYANQKEATKVRDSGYTALQINFKLTNGQVFEWQFRGDKINIFAEAEHVPYDLRTGKDIISAHPEVEPLYKPIEKLLSVDSMKPEQYNKYNEYLTDYYKHLRKLELGFNSTEPKLSDYGNFDNRLSAKNLENLHICAEEIKKHPEQTKEILRKYEQLVNN